MKNKNSIIKELEEIKSNLEKYTKPKNKKIKVKEPKLKWYQRIALFFDWTKSIKHNLKY